MAEALGLTIEQGILLQGVVEGGPADRAGLRGFDPQADIDGDAGSGSGDIIVAIDGVAVRDMDDLIVYLASTSVGQTVRLEIIRDGTSQNVEVILEERPEQ